VNLFNILIGKLSFLFGYIKGRIDGKHGAEELTLLMKQYGQFERIPTRKLKALPCGTALAERQRLKVALMSLNTMVEEFGLLPIVNLCNAVADYLDFNKLEPALEQEIAAAQVSLSVFQSLIELAEKTDGFSLKIFLHHVEANNSATTYFTLCDNSTYLVDE